MTELCDICGSLVRQGHCSNERCGTGNIPRGWKAKTKISIRQEEQKMAEKTCTLKEVSDQDGHGFSKWYCDACESVWEWEEATDVLFCPDCGAKVIYWWGKDGE